MKQNNVKNYKDGLFVISFVAIPVVLLSVFTFYPALKLLYYSFTDYDGISSNITWIGLYNWKKLLGSSEAWKSLVNCLYYIVGGVVQNIVGLLLAINLNNEKVKCRNVFRGIVFLPFILNGTAVSYMFRYLYDFTKGPLNKMLALLGAEPVAWLGSAELVNWSLAIVCFWRYTGYIMVIYLAALQSIPSEYYEAACIDGAGAWGKLRYITLPQITSIIGMQMFLNISGAVNIFDVPYVITGGGPAGASKTLTILAHEYAFKYDDYGLASAYGVFCTVAIVIIYCIQNRMSKNREE